MKLPISVWLSLFVMSTAHGMSPQEYYQLAEESKTTNPHKAIILYEQALKQDSNYLDAAFAVASLYFDQHNFQDALHHFTHVTELDPKCTAAWYNASLCLKSLERYSEMLTTLYKVIQLSPHHVNAHLNIGHALEKLGKNDVALATYKYLLTLDPRSFEAHYRLGILERGFDHFENAIAHLRTAVEINPDHTNATIELANALHLVGIYPECIELYEKVLERNPDNIGVLYNYGYTLKRLGYVQEAIDVYNKVLEKKPDYALARFSRSLGYLTLGDFERGWAEYDWRWQAYGEKARNYPHIKIWDGSDLTGKTILVYCEQGLGDTFQFIRYARELKKLGAIVIVETQKPLKQLLGLCPYIDRVYGYGEQVPPQYDYQIALMSLPSILKTTINTVPTDIPYLYATQERLDYWHEQLAPDTNFKIGICWQGNANYSTQALRQAVALKSMNVTNFEPLMHIPGVSVYSLQMISGTDQLATLSDPTLLKTFGPDFDNSHGRFMDTVAVMQQLDLVISIDTSICHLAAALGVPTWVILPNPADWRWMLEREDTPWYPTMCLFRQRAFGDWSDVMQDIMQAVSIIMKHHTCSQ